MCFWWRGAVRLGLHNSLDKDSGNSLQFTIYSCKFLVVSGGGEERGRQATKESVNYAAVRNPQEQGTYR